MDGARQGLLEYFGVKGGRARSSTMKLEGERPQNCFGVNSKVGGDGRAAFVGVGFSREP